MRAPPGRPEDDCGDAGRLDEGGIHPVRLAVELGRAPGAVGLVRCGRSPSVVRDEIINEIRARQADDGYIQLSRETVYAPGEAVRIESGSLCDQVGIFQCTADNERVVILLNLLGRQVPVTLSVDDVAREG